MSPEPASTPLHTYTSSLTTKAEGLSQSRLGLWILACISFLESALPVPILTDPFLAAAVLCNRKKAVLVIAITTLSSALGGLFAYYTAFFAFGFIASNLSLEVLNSFNTIIENNDANTLTLTLLGAVTPIPYTIVSWVVGVLAGNPVVFIIASIIGRGFRYAIVGFCAYQFGPLAVRYARKYMMLSSIVLVILIGIVIFLKTQLL